MAATYENKYLLKSNIYSGHFGVFDTVEECKASFEALMVDEDYMSFDTGDTEYYIIPIVWATWTEE